MRLRIRLSQSVTRGIIDTAREIGAGLIVIGAGSGAVSPIVGALLHASPVPVAMAPRAYRKLACAVGARPGVQQVVEVYVSAVERVGLPLHLSIHSSTWRAATVRSARRPRAPPNTPLSRPRPPSQGAMRCAPTSAKAAPSRQPWARSRWQERSTLVVGSSRLAVGRQAFLGTMAARILAHLPIPIIIVPAHHDGGDDRTA